MAKKSPKNNDNAQQFQTLNEFDFDNELFDYEGLDGNMENFLGHAADSYKALQHTALELTKLALAHCTKPNEDKVFELFRRAADEISQLYEQED